MESDFNFVYEVSYRMGFRIESDEELTRKELAERWTEMVYQWVEEGNRPDHERMDVQVKGTSGAIVPVDQDNPVDEELFSGEGGASVLEDLRRYQGDDR